MRHDTNMAVDETCVPDTDYFIVVNNYECTTLHHFCNLCRNEKAETCREYMSDFDFVLRFLGRFLG